MGRGVKLKKTCDIIFERPLIGRRFESTHAAWRGGKTAESTLRGHSDTFFNISICYHNIFIHLFFSWPQTAIYGILDKKKEYEKKEKETQIN